MCKARGISLFCDAAQWLGKLPASGLGTCDYLAGCGHKFGGPAGVGFLKAPDRVKPLLVGGGQEEGQRAGTENLAGVLSMVAALREREAAQQEQVPSGLATRKRFEELLLQKVPDLEILGGTEERLWNTVSVIMPPIECRQRWVVKLDRLGFAASTGSACASGREKASHVLQAMGVTAEKAGRVLRFSGGWETRDSDWCELLSGIERAVQEVAGRAL